MPEFATPTRAEMSLLRERLPAVTKEQISATYGISETTWRKLQSGLAVKRSTMDRIWRRYSLLVGSTYPRSRGDQHGAPVPT
jgi:hypothetical protein